jgi:hypothetical protein
MSDLQHWDGTSYNNKKAEREAEKRLNEVQDDD